MKIVLELPEGTNPDFAKRWVDHLNQQRKPRLDILVVSLYAGMDPMTIDITKATLKE